MSEILADVFPELEVVPEDVVSCRFLRLMVGL